MCSSKFLNPQNSTMAEGKEFIKIKLIKPFIGLFRKNKKNNKATEITTNKASKSENATTNEIHVEAPFDNLLKKLEKLDIDKKARLEATTLNNDNDSICDSDIENDKELHEKFDKKTRNDTTPVDKNENYENDKESNNDDAELLEKFNELEIEKKEVTQTEEDEEEMKKFSTKIVTDDARALRIDSQSSQDSGFGEKCSLIESDDENPDKDVDRIGRKDGEEEKKEGKAQKKLHKAYVRRGPIKSKRSQAPITAPYPCEINLNPQIYSGGKVIINPNQFVQPPQSTPSTFIEASTPTFTETSTQNYELNIELTIELDRYLSQEDINKCLNALDLPQPEYDPDSTYLTPTQYDFTLNSTPPLIPEFELSPPYDHVSENVLNDLDPYVLTPPSSVHSQSMYSPKTYRGSPLKSIDTSPNSDALSWNEELEHFRVITPNEPIYPSPYDAEMKESITSESPRLYKKLKDYKDRQKELAKEFSKMECCQIILKPCKEVFNEHLQKLQDGDKRKLCYGVANLEMTYAFRVLMHILQDLSTSDQAEDLKMALFCLVCEKVLSTQKTLFIEEFGLNLLQFAVLRCFKRPVITRYLVQCIRVVTRSAEYTCPTKTVYNKVDSNGDNLLIACVREGDRCAHVLRELVRVDDNDVPLFDVHHVNTDGYTALHVCCSEHSASTPRAHTLHVLLQHARAERERQDRKGGETPLHLAVNSANCSLDMILIYFHYIERNQWYNLTHMKNSSGKNPLEYAKFGKKSRPNYPREILDFLERCRK